MYPHCTQNDDAHAWGQKEKEPALSQDLHNENENRHCFVHRRHHHQRLVDKTLAGANFNVCGVRDSARGLGMVPCLDIFCTEENGELRVDNGELIIYPISLGVFSL